jgi:hypothetical protein
MQISWQKSVVSIPMPIFLVVEDVGWWQGADGSANNQPFRNGFSRRHCLDDYRALCRLAKKLQMRIALGMVLGEWDRTNLLKNIVGATWQGAAWDNRIDRVSRLDETAQYLCDHRKYLEIALHGLCHEFWQDGLMVRSEFHDDDGVMRRERIVRSHIEAFGALLKQNNLPDFPRLFIPPALKHSFGNGKKSVQAILHDYGLRYVITDFSRARQYSPPLYDKITWECGVGLLERGKSPVAWNQPAALPPVWDFVNPVLPLHWSNLLHPDPAQNNEVIDRWANFLLAATTGPDCIAAGDIDSCWQQTAVAQLATLQTNNRELLIDLHRVPDHISCRCQTFFLKIQDAPPGSIQCRGARIVSCKHDRPDLRTLGILPDKGQKKLVLAAN